MKAMVITDIWPVNEEREILKEVDIPIPEPDDGMIRIKISTWPAWKPVVYALWHLKPGGRLVINAISKEENDKKELLKIEYDRNLWMEYESKLKRPRDLKEIKEL